MSPPDAALWALIAISLVLIGALLTAGIVSIEQRAAVLGAILLVLASIGYRIRKNGSS